MLRTLATFGYYFGSAPMVATRIRLTTHTLEDARRVALDHVRRAQRIAGITFSVEGRENLPANGGFVLVFNETSYVDIFVTIDALWQLTDRSILAQDYAHIPLVRRAAEQLGFVFMPRGNRAGTDAVLARLGAFVSGGGSVALGAQGGVSREAGVPHFKRGGFLVAIRARTPVVPMCVRGGREVLRPGSLQMHPGHIRCIIDAPIPTNGLSDEDAPALAERARSRVAELMA